MAITQRTAVEWRTLAATGDLVQTADTVKSDPEGEWAAEPKLDGWRIVAVVGDDGVDLYARSGNAITGSLPHIAAALSVFPAGTVFDGEAVALRTAEDGRLVNDWSAAQSVLSTVGPHAAADRISYVVFDLLSHAGIDARPLRYTGRRAILERCFEGWDQDGPVQVIPAKVASGATLKGLHEAHIAAGFEGTVLKRLDSIYAGGRRPAWRKWKPQQTREFVIMGFTESKRNTGLIGSIVFGAYDDAGTLVECGHCSGMNMATRRSMTEHPEKYIGTVIEVAHFDPAKVGGKARSPQWKRSRPDLNAPMVKL